MTAYSKQTWVDNDATKPANATRLNHIEDGIAAAQATADAASTLTIGTTSTTAKAGNWKPALADLPAGMVLSSPLDGTVSTDATLARPSARTDIFFVWNMTVQPNNMITGDKWEQPA